MAETDPLLATVITIGLAVPGGVAAQEATPDASTPPLATPSANVTVVATGLDNPRGSAWDADGALYIGTLMNFPVAAVAATVYRLTLDGVLSDYATGFTAVTGVAFDNQGRLYVLEASGAGGSDAPIVPGTGRVVRWTAEGGLEVVATGLAFPAAMAFGPDGKLYVANHGFLYPPGAGDIVTIDVGAPAGA